MNEDALHDFIAAIFKEWENSIYYGGPTDAKVKKLTEYQKSYLELSSSASDLD